MTTKLNVWQKSSSTLLLVAGLALACGVAQAQPATMTANRSQNPSLPGQANTKAQPWTIGVSPERQKRAETLYQEGNRYFTSGIFTAAVAKYQEALQHWNHPGIHYNLALAMISLDRPIEAYENIVAALAHGTEGLHPDEYQRATHHQRELRQRIAEVEVICNEPGADVTLDGKPIFTGPGRVITMVLPGKHQVVASKAGYRITIKAFKLAAAARTRLELHLVAAYQSSTRIQHRRTWPQWAATGLGLGAGAAAATLHWQFRVDSDRLSDMLRTECPTGCLTYPEELVPLRERLEWQRNVAYAGYAAAGALLATGAVLMYLDRPQTTKTGARHAAVQLSLSAGDPAGSRGISVHISF